MLAAPDVLRRWAVRLGLGDTGASAARAELDRALELLGALHAAFAAIGLGNEPPTPALRAIAQNHAEAAAAARLEPAGDGTFRLAWRGTDPNRIRYAVAVDAVTLLADPERARRIRHCPGHDCGWVFLDLSGRRRWCSMDTCGSRAKMRRLYERQRAMRH